MLWLRVGRNAGGYFLLPSRLSLGHPACYVCPKSFAHSASLIHSSASRLSYTVSFTPLNRPSDDIAIYLMNLPINTVGVYGNVINFARGLFLVKGF